MSSFKKAVRTRVKLKILLTGPSGSGKTTGALALASGLAPGKVAGIDSEHDRMAYYADDYDFAHLTLTDVTPRSYMDAVDMAVREGFEVVVIDSLSHCWNDLLARKLAYERSKPGSNSFTLWGIFGAEWEKLMQHLLAAPIHVIATSRSKQAYEQVTGADGKKSVEKLGLAPQVRDGAEYEFALSFDVNRAHLAECTKDNTALFSAENTLWNLRDPNMVTMLHNWMNSAAPVPVVPMATGEQYEELDELLAGEEFTDEERAGALSGITTALEADARIAEVRALAEVRARAAATPAFAV